MVTYLASVVLIDFVKGMFIFIPGYLYGRLKMFQFETK